VRIPITSVAAVRSATERLASPRPPVRFVHRSLPVPSCLPRLTSSLFDLRASGIGGLRVGRCYLVWYDTGFTRDDSSTGTRFFKQIGRHESRNDIERIFEKTFSFPPLPQTGFFDRPVKSLKSYYYYYYYWFFLSRFRRAVEHNARFVDDITTRYPSI